MANICVNEYYFKGDEKALEKLFDLFEENDSLAKTFKNNKIEGADKAKGIICDIDRESWYITIDTPWHPYRETIDSLISYTGENIQYCCYSEEPGCEIFQVYDPDNLGAFDDWEYVLRYNLCGKDEGGKLTELQRFDSYFSEDFFLALVERISGKVPTTVDDGLSILRSLKRDDNTEIYLNPIKAVS